MANRRDAQFWDSHTVPLPFLEIQEITKKLQQVKFQHYPENRSINIQVIDDTALIIGKFNRKRKPRNKNKKKQLVLFVYSRAEMEALRFHNSHHQNNKWAQVYAALPPLVAAEYDALLPINRFAPRPFPHK